MKSDSIVIENKEKRMFFTNETLRAMIIPLFLEQLLVMLEEEGEEKTYDYIRAYVLKEK